MEKFVDTTLFSNLFNINKLQDKPLKTVKIHLFVLFYII